MFVATVLCQNIIAQNYAKIDVDLQQEMMLRDSADLIRINIILNQQYDQMEMRSKSSVYRTKEDKRSFVISELKRFSEETQLGIMELLSTMTDVSEIQSFNLHYSKKNRFLIPLSSNRNDCLLLGSCLRKSAARSLSEVEAPPISSDLPKKMKSHSDRREESVFQMLTLNLYNSMNNIG